MSREDVEVVRRSLRQNNPRGLQDRAAVEALWHPDSELAAALNSIDSQTFRGYDGLADYLEEMLSAFEDWSQSEEKLVDTGTGTIVATWWFEGRGRASGAPFRRRVGGVIDVETGRIRRWRTFLDLGDAYAAAGLDPP